MTFLSKYGAARHIYVPMVKRGVVDHAVGADWTPSAGDVKISKDGGAAANVTNLPTAIAMGNSALWDFSLTATEMEAAQIVVTVADSATKAVEDNGFVIETYGHASAQHAADLDDGVRLGLTALPNAAADAAGGLPISDAGGLDLDAQRSDVAAILVDTGTTLDGKADTIAGYLDTEVAAVLAAVDTEVAAIKAKTDNLPSDPADASDIAAATAAIIADTEDIQARLPAALTGAGNMKSDALAISGSTDAADLLEESAETIATGTASSGTTTTLVASALSPASAVNDQIVGRKILFKRDTTTAALRSQGSAITDFDHATQTITFDALTTAVANGDTFVIV